MKNNSKKDVENFYLEGLNAVISKENTHNNNVNILSGVNRTKDTLSKQIVTGNTAAFIESIKVLDTNAMKSVLNNAVNRTDPVDTFINAFAKDYVKRNRNPEGLTAEGVKRVWKKFKAHFLKTNGFALVSEAIGAIDIISSLYNDEKKYYREAIQMDNLLPTKDGTADEGSEEEEEEEEIVGDDEEKDSQDEADEILSNIDLLTISNEIRQELISAIIDSAQNESEEDEEFTEFVEKIEEILNSFRTDNDDENDEGKFDEIEDEGGEEFADEGGEEFEDEGSEEEI